MTVTQIILISWLALGLLSVAVIEIASRGSNTDGPLSQSNAHESIFFTLALIVGAPVLAIYALGISAQTLWEGRIPVSGKEWWPARARRMGRINRFVFGGELSQSEILCDMVNTRKRDDKRLRNENPWNWPWSLLADSPEAIILDAVSNFHWLLDGGLDEKEAVEHLQSLDGAVEQSSEAVMLRTFIEQKLRLVDPPYLELKPAILTKNIFLATKRVRKNLDRIKSSPSYPPSEWLGSKIEYGEPVPPLFSVPGRPVALGDGDWHRLRARMANGDEFRLFCSPPESWASLTGRSGVALVRNGRSIAHVITAMN
jgi:hypothetical protein